MYQYANAQRLLGILVAVFALTMVPPLLVSFYYRDGASETFLDALLIMLLVGALMWFPVRNTPYQELRVRDGCLVVVLYWVVFSLVGALPLYMFPGGWPTFTDAVFESVSGITTTGATVATGLDYMPHAINFYRMQLHFLGGMGIIVLAVAVLPMLGVGGMQMIRAETPGPMKDSKLTPRITETARALWLVYVSFAILCALSFWLAGMTPFDAICHAMSVMGTGGFSTHDSSLAYYHSLPIELVAMLFMLLAAANFALHFTAWRRNSLKVYAKDPEFRVYIGIIAFISLSFATVLYLNNSYPSFLVALHYAAFNVISLGTSTGLTTVDYNNWPGPLPVILITSAAFCGCAGSTASGIKVIRVQLLVKYVYRELLRIIHPNAEVPIKSGGKLVNPTVLEAVSGFFAAYAFLFVFIWVLFMSVGLDPLTAYSAVATTINNMGPGLGSLEFGFSQTDTAVKWISIFSMLLGRLEIFTLLAVLTPAFWRR